MGKMNRSGIPVYFGLLIVVIGLFYFFNPSSSGFFLKCPIYYFTGLHCPGCGTQRALHALLHSDFQTAWQFNPLIFLMIPLFAYFVSSKIFGWSGEWLNNVYFIGFCILFLIAYFIIRNLPFEPFCRLAPG